MTRVLALDPSTKAIGFVVADGDHGNDYVTSGTFHLMGSGSLVKVNDEALLRCRQFATWLEQQVVDWQPRITIAEGPTGDHANRRSDRRGGPGQPARRFASSPALR
jgi:hypothetical protein